MKKIFQIKNDNINNQQDENQNLINEKEKNEKNYLLEIFQRLKKQLNENNKDTISEAYSQEEKEYMKKMKYDIKKCSFFFIFMFSFVNGFFAICYLVAFFIIAPISNLIFNLLFSSLKCRLDISCNKNEFSERKNFFNYLFSESRKLSIDIDLMMFWSFIGLEILESCQFRKTCSLLLISNIIMLCLIYIFDFRISEENYSIIRIILLAFLYLFISLTLGSSSLISQQAVINIYSNLNLFSDENVNENYSKVFSESGNDNKNNENTQNLKNIITKENNINKEVNDNSKEIIYNKH